jgi:hypothetical protein
MVEFSNALTDDVRSLSMPPGDDSSGTHPTLGPTDPFLTLPTSATILYIFPCHSCTWCAFGVFTWLTGSSAPRYTSDLTVNAHLSDQDLVLSPLFVALTFVLSDRYYTSV